MNDEILSNQTQFAQEEPLFEVQKAVQSQPTYDEVTDSKKKPKLLIIGGGVFALVLVLILALVLLSKPKRIEVTKEVEASPSPKNTINHPLQQRVTNLQQELDLADPSEQSLVFPPVDMTITLDPVKQ